MYNFNKLISYKIMPKFKGIIDNLNLYNETNDLVNIHQQTILNSLREFGAVIEYDNNKFKLLVLNINFNQIKGIEFELKNLIELSREGITNGYHNVQRTLNFN